MLLVQNLALFVLYKTSLLGSDEKIMEKKKDVVFLRNETEQEPNGAQQTRTSARRRCEGDRVAHT